MRLLFLGVLFSVINFFIKGKRGIYLMFLGILIVMGFQGKAGHDYIGYEYYFSLINSSVDSQYYTDYIESGWILLNKLFSFANFPIFVFFISFIQYLILVCFVGKYVSRNVWVNFAFFLFFFTQSFLGFQLSGLRQGFAIELLVFSFICVDKRRYVWALLSALFMYNIHHSSLVAVPFLVLFYLYTKGHFHKIEKYFHSKIIIIFPIIFVIL